MNSTVVKTIIAGAIIMGIGLGILILAGALNGWNFTVNADWEKQKYEYSETVTDVDIDFSAGSLQLEFFDGEQIEVEYYTCDKFTTEFNVVDGTLHVSTSSVRWYHSFLWFHKIPETKMYIPRSWQLNFDVVINAGAVTFGEGGNYGDVKVELNAGSITMLNVNCQVCSLEVNAGAMDLTGLTCNKLTCEVNAGAVNVQQLKCNSIGIEVSAGSANVGIAGQKSEYTIKVRKSAGSCNVTNQTGTDASKSIDIGVSAGSANVTFSN